MVDVEVVAEGAALQQRAHRVRASAWPPPRACRTSAAIPAACGAAALVPKKFGCVSGSSLESSVKNVVFPPSVAVTCGTWRMSGLGSRLPAESK